MTDDDPYRFWKSMYGFGVMVAAIVSYGENRSIFWLLLHSVCSWLYVAYAGLFL